ncbi:hypothetical protein FZ983_07380 [Azospirillum sp. B21]|uniref:hypothetical protein n=1 Tax=Azospirillum sp. B21 TaxID=2607496 RepID=UPI0011EF98C2|nr:hypothetical protein [Azospirillum sp. B21]KAA0582301.1 hypothetical protein FZ983_07380 [Azospirillum sp. B21]
MSTTYSVAVTMDQNTLTTLKNNGFILYGFKGISTPNGSSAQPTVWFSTNQYLTSTTISWTENYKAYISSQQIQANTTIDASNNISADLGNLVTVDGNGMLTVSTTGGTSGAVSVYDNSSNPYTTGLSQAANGGPATPLCALSLLGQTTDVIVPIEYVLLMFATQTVDTGTVLYNAYTQSIAVDLTGAPANSRSVSYVVNQGWQTDGATWATVYPPNAALKPLLINPM